MLETLEKVLDELKGQNLCPTKKKVVKVVKMMDMAEDDRRVIMEYLELFHEREAVFIPVNKFKN